MNEPNNNCDVSSITSSQHERNRLSFDFDNWIDSNSLTNIKYLFIKHKMTLYNKISMSNGDNLVLFIQELTTKHSHLVSKTIGAIQKLDATKKINELPQLPIRNNIRDNLASLDVINFELKQLESDCNNILNNQNPENKQISLNLSNISKNFLEINNITNFTENKIKNDIIIYNKELNDYYKNNNIKLNILKNLMQSVQNQIKYQNNILNNNITDINIGNDCNKKYNNLKNRTQNTISQLKQPDIKPNINIIYESKYQIKIIKYIKKLYKIDGRNHIDNDNTIITGSNDINKELNELKKENDTIKKENNSIRTANKTIKLMCQKDKERISDLKNKISEYELQLEKRNKFINEREKEFIKLNTNYKNQIKILKNNQNNKNDNKSWEKMDQLTQSNELLKKEISSLKLTLKNKEIEHDDLRTSVYPQIRDLQQRVKDQINEIDQVKYENNELIDTNKNLKIDIKILEENQEKIIKQLHDARKKNKLIKQLQEAKNKNKNKNNKSPISNNTNVNSQNAKSQISNGFNHKNKSPMKNHRNMKSPRSNPINPSNFSNGNNRNKNPNNYNNKSPMKNYRNINGQNGKSPIKMINQRSVRNGNNHKNNGSNIRNNNRISSVNQSNNNYMNKVLNILKPKMIIDNNNGCEYIDEYCKINDIGTPKVYYKNITKNNQTQWQVTIIIHGKIKVIKAIYCAKKKKEAREGCYKRLANKISKGIV